MLSRVKNWLGHRRLLRFFSSFVRKGDLVFDIGAHVGDRAAVFRRLGAQVVAVEPQRACVQALRERFRGDAGVTIEHAAVGDAEGSMQLAKVRGYPAIASLSPEWQHRGPFAEGFRDAEHETVRVTTLDRLIERYGVPGFCKIDVEEYEDRVLAGLSYALPSLSFEYHRSFPEKTAHCLTRLESLGPYRYRLSREESAEWFSPDWMDKGALMRQLASIPDDTHGWGDIYATLND